MKSDCRLVVTGVLLASLLWSVSALGSGGTPEDASLPAEFERLLPRGALASIDDPTFVAADEAEIADESWVLGVVIDGQARAYSLAILNSHEVVNDVISGQPLAAVW